MAPPESVDLFAGTERVACLDVPALPLQLLLLRHPEFRLHPAAVVAEEKPNGLILWVNEQARQSRILPGIRYAAALSLSRQLRAGVVTEGEITKAVAGLAEILRGYSPEIEASEEEPGVFWMAAGGLAEEKPKIHHRDTEITEETQRKTTDETKYLYPSLESWTLAVTAALAKNGYGARLAVGFSRFATYALSKIPPDRKVFENPAAEQKAARDVPLDRLRLAPNDRDLLEKLGITDVGGFVNLPPGGILSRFGPTLARLHRMARGELWTPLQPKVFLAPLTEKMDLDFPESDLARVLFLVKRLLHPLLDALIVRGEAVYELSLTLAFDRPAASRGAMPERCERVRPARPTLDVLQLMDLVHLRLAAISFDSGVMRVTLDATGVAASPEQLLIAAGEARRDLSAGDRALARLRAEFGDTSVVRARLTAGHLPEASFTWELMPHLVLPRPRDVAFRPLVRRLYAKPVLLPPPPSIEPETWFASSRRGGPVLRRFGPYIVSGGWWAREIHREYHFLETERGDLIWLYYDRIRRKWFQQGEAE